MVAMAPPSRRKLHNPSTKFLSVTALLVVAVYALRQGPSVVSNLNEGRAARSAVLGDIGRATELAAELQAVLADRELRLALGAKQCPQRAPGRPVGSVVVVHIPKTAGTFLHGVLQRVLPASGSGRWCTRGADSTTDLPLVSATCGRGDPPPDQVELFEATRKSFRHTCSGFTAHQDVEYFNAVGIDYNQTLTITALRHPVDRVISEYYYALRAGAEWMRPYLPNNDTDFSGMVRLVESNGINANNLMTSHLGAGKHCRFPGAAPTTPEEQKLEAAKRNLSRICLLVLSEFMDESLVRLARAGGWSSRRLLSVAAQLQEEAGGRVNAGNNPLVPWDVRRVIEQYNELDMQLYEFATQLFMRRRYSDA